MQAHNYSPATLTTEAQEEVKFWKHSNLRDWLWSDTPQAANKLHKLSHWVMLSSITYVT